MLQSKNLTRGEVIPRHFKPKLMKKILFVWTAIVISGLISSCQNSRNYVNIDINGLNEEELLNNSDGILKIERVIPLKFGNDVHIGIIDKVSLIDTFIIVKDQYGIYEFNINGEYKRRISQKGLANNEYISLRTYYINKKKNINIVDAGTNRILKYRFDGNFLSSQNIKFDKEYIITLEDIEEISEDKLFIYSDIFNDFQDSYNIISSSFDKIEPIDMINIKSKGKAYAFSSHPISTYNNIIRYVKPFDNRIFMLNSDTVLNLVTSEKVLIDNDLDKISPLTSNKLARYISNNEFFIGFSDIFETEKYIFLNFHDFYYIILDKQNRKCKKYSYKYSKNSDFSPIVHIVGQNNNNFLGVLGTRVSIDLKNNEKNESLYNVLGDKKYSERPVIIEYSFRDN